MSVRYKQDIERKGDKLTVLHSATKLCVQFGRDKNNLDVRKYVPAYVVYGASTKETLIKILEKLGYNLLEE